MIRHIRYALLLSLSVLLFAVETGPLQIHRIIDGDTIEVLADLGGLPHTVSVRLLWLDTPETRGKDAIHEGELAKGYLQRLLADVNTVTLWGPAAELERDRYGRVLAVVSALRIPNPEEVEAARKKIGVGEGAHMHDMWVKENLNAGMIHAGWSAYWRKYGEAPDRDQHQFLLECQETAEREGRGAWATAPKWMRDKANERTAPAQE